MESRWVTPQTLGGGKRERGGDAGLVEYVMYGMHAARLLRKTTKFNPAFAVNPGLGQKL